jgi:hypothetical protein
MLTLLFAIVSLRETVPGSAVGDGQESQVPYGENGRDL